VGPEKRSTGEILKKRRGVRNMKLTRKVGYSPAYEFPDVPRITFEGKWIIKKYGWKVGDTVNVKFGKSFIKIFKNSAN